MANAAPEPFSIEPPATVAAIEKNKPKTVPVKLLRNYRPASEYEVVGWHKPAVTVKDAGGRLRELEPAEFVEGVEAPPPMSGVGSGQRVWAGTVIRVPAEEAKAMRKAGIADIEVD